MPRKPKRWFWIALITPVVMLLCMCYKPAMTYFFGDTIVLKTTLVDSTDVFYGDYVDLHFQIKEANAKQTESALNKKLKKLDKKNSPMNLFLIKGPEYEKERFEKIPVYVILAPSGKEYVIKKVTSSRPNTGIYLEANFLPWKTEGDHYHLRYPMERFYVEEGTKRKLQEIARTGSAYVFVKVKNGYAMITKVEKSVK